MTLDLTWACMHDCNARCALPAEGRVTERVLQLHVDGSIMHIPTPRAPPTHSEASKQRSTPHDDKPRKMR